MKYYLLLGLLLLSLFLTSCSSDPVCNTVQVPYDAQEEYMKTEYYTETVPYTDTVCEYETIPYSIDNFIVSYDKCNQERDICNDYLLGFCTDTTTFCVDRTVGCSLDLKNLDSEEPGSFEVSFVYSSVDGDSLGTKSDSNYVYAQVTESFSSWIRITSDEVDGNANKRWSCHYSVSHVPQKKVCNDVVKYKDVEKERQVTAYRPVTKYRSEEVCN